MLVYYNCIDKSTHKIEWTNKYRFWSLCYNLLQYKFYLGFMVVDNYFIDMFFFMQTKVHAIWYGVQLFSSYEPMVFDLSNCGLDVWWA